MDKQERAMGYAQGISRMIQVNTVRCPGRDRENFDRLHAVMEELFPRTFRTCTRWDFESSLLLRWQGRSRRALVLMSHQDVVEAPGNWTYPPFSGTIAGGRLWGRGTLDVKGNLFSILQAIEELMAEGFVPPWDVYVASSHEEETGGNTLIVDFLRQQGVIPELLVDEGSSVQPCPEPSVGGHAAMVAVAEKGYADIRCVARGPGGHASIPGKWTPLPRLGAFMCEVESAGLFPLRIDQASAEMYRRMAALTPEGSERERLAGIASQQPGWQQLLGDRQRAMLGTTVAFTMAGGSQAANVIPQEAYVTCNIRIAPGETVDGTVKTLRTVADRHQIELEVLRSNEPSPVTDPAGAAFARVEQAIQNVWPGVGVLPFLLSGGTDTKHFVDLCPNCLRFTAYRISAEQQGLCHAVDENVDLDTIPDGVDFFKCLIQELEGE